MLSLAVKKKLCIVYCANLDGWHEEFFACYAISDVKIFLEPTFQEAAEIIRFHPHLEMVSISHTCIHCKRKGVKG